MNAVDILQYGHQTVVEAVAGLPATDWQQPGVVGVWSTADLIAHLASFEDVLGDVLGALNREGQAASDSSPLLARFAADPQRFNDEEVARRQSLTVEEVWAAYEAAHEHNVTLLTALPMKARRQKGTLPWYGREYDLEDFLVYTFYGHKREHAAQIGVFRAALAERRTTPASTHATP